MIKRPFHGIQTPFETYQRCLEIYDIRITFCEQEMIKVPPFPDTPRLSLGRVLAQRRFHCGRVIEGYDADSCPARGEQILGQSLDLRI